MKLTKKTIKIANGETLAYIEEGNPKNKTLLLVHGNFSSGMHYYRAIKNLSPEFHIIAPDMRGFGDSSYNNRISTLKELGDDLILLLDALKIDKAFVLGWSLGGGVVMEMAAHHPDRVEKLVLVASTTHRGYPVFKKDKNMQQILGEVYESPEEMGTDPVQVLPLLTAQKNQDFEAMSQAYQAMFLVEPEEEEKEMMIKEALKQVNLIDADWAISTINMSDKPSAYNKGEGTITQIKCPVLHLWGMKDLWLAPEYMTLDNYTALKSQSTIIRYTECGHIIFIDKEEESTKDIIKFLKE